MKKLEPDLPEFKSWPLHSLAVCLDRCPLLSSLCFMCKSDRITMPAHMGVVTLPEWMQQGASYGAWHVGYTPEMRVTATAVVIAVARKGSACSDSVYSFIGPWSMSINPY